MKNRVHLFFQFFASLIPCHLWLSYSDLAYCMDNSE